MHTITQLAPDDIPAAAEVIRQAFATVAEAFDLTEENCPTNGAFLRDAALAEEQERGTVLYGLPVPAKQVTAVVRYIAGLQHHDRQPD